MNPLCAAICIHFTVVVDRIETPWAVVEWQDTQAVSDIALHRFTQRPKEGSAWRVHFGTEPNKSGASMRLSPMEFTGSDKRKEAPSTH